MGLFSASKEAFSACRAKLLWRGPKPAAGIGWAPKDFSGLWMKDSETDIRSWKVQAAAQRNKMESSRTDASEEQWCVSLRRCCLCLWGRSVLLSFNLTVHFNKHFREICSQEGSEIPKPLTAVKHQVNFSVLGRSGELEIRKKKRIGQDFVLFLQRRWSKWCCSCGISDLSETESTWVLCVFFSPLFGSQKFTILFKKSIHIFIFNDNSSLDVLGSDPITLLAVVFTPVVEANVLLVVLKPIRLLTQVGPRYVNQYCKMHPGVCKWKTLAPIGRLCVWFSSQLH